MQNKFKTCKTCKHRNSNEYFEPWCKNCVDGSEFSIDGSMLLKKERILGKILVVVLILNVVALSFFVGMSAFPFSAMNAQNAIAWGMTNQIKGFALDDTGYFRDIAAENEWSLKCAGFEESCMYFEIEEYVINNIRYVPDPLNIEELSHPKIILERGWGDCDDFATVFLAFAISVNREAKIVRGGNHTWVSTPIGDFLE